MNNDEEVCLQEMINFDFESRKSFEDFVIAIYWIGYNVNHDHLSKCNKLKQRFEKAGLLSFGDNKLFRQFELTYEGNPICINDYANWIAEEPNTHVIHIDDRFELNMIEHDKYVEYIQDDYDLQS